MKKRLWLILFAVVLSFALAAPSYAELQNMWATVYRHNGKLNADGTNAITPVTSGITYKVLAAGANTAETLYAYDDRYLTSKTNAVTSTVFATDKMIKFQVDPTDATYDRYVDLIVVDQAGGYTAFIKNFDKYTHAVVIDERPNVVHHGCIWFSGTTTNATSTGILFDKYTNIRTVGLEVVTVLSGQTINIGTETTATAFINKELLTTAGFITTSGASTGSLLGSGTAYQWYNQGVTITTAASYLYYTVSSTTGTPAGYIHFWFTRVR